MAKATQQDVIELEKKLLETQEKIDAKREDLEHEKAAIEKKRQEYVKKLESVSHLTAEEAKEQLIKETEKDAAGMMAKIIREKEDEAKATADAKAQEILVDSLKHGALQFVPEYTVSVVKVDDEDMKGRIIGKEGRNIRAFEQATGVDVDLDEEGIIRLSSFDQVRREVARRSLEKLLKDTRVQPFRIEEIVAQTNPQVPQTTPQEGA